jgi:hypothetical protein
VPAVSATRDILEQYLRRLGLSAPADAVLQIQVTLLRQWCEHLEDVLEAEAVDAARRLRIIRAMIYGGTPHLAEQEIRQQMTTEMAKLAPHANPPAGMRAGDARE